MLPGRKVADVAEVEEVMPLHSKKEKKKRSLVQYSVKLTKLIATSWHGESWCALLIFRLAIRSPSPCVLGSVLRVFWRS